ncbi:MAG: ferredoxin:glutaredoxin reductase [Fusobacteria bacterium]|nr:ferredoxin:glutaredoxin reductase [Fusobacteriota bacterium]
MSKNKEYTDKLRKEAQEGGYLLNPDQAFVDDLAQGLLANIERYGYGGCPCRLNKGEYEADKDIICPCDYRDNDLNEYGICYCGLYVVKEIAEGQKELSSIPDRRKKALLAKKSTNNGAEVTQETTKLNGKYPVWRCSVCGYLCARTQPPEICPICKVSKDRFELF